MDSRSSDQTACIHELVAGLVCPKIVFFVVFFLTVVTLNLDKLNDSNTCTEMDELVSGIKHKKCYKKK